MNVAVVGGRWSVVMYNFLGAIGDVFVVGVSVVLDLSTVGRHFLYQQSGHPVGRSES
ncbi:hypothetical protein D3C84_1200510 [compost metagenome]